MFCDPRYAPTLTTIKEKQQLYEVAKKFEMAGIAHRVGIKEALRAISCLEKEPVKAYAIACRLQLEDEAREAAKYTLQLPLSERSDMPELELISAGTLQRLHDYHFKCIKAARHVAMHFQWI